MNKSKTIFLFFFNMIFYIMTINAAVIPFLNNNSFDNNNNGNSWRDNLNNYGNSIKNTFNNYGNSLKNSFSNLFGNSSSNSLGRPQGVNSPLSSSNSNSNGNGRRYHYPVIFIHGMNSDDTAFDVHMNFLARQGWDYGSMFSVDLPDKVAFGPINAEVISSEVDQLLQRTGAQKVNIVCHSMGGANTMNYILNAGGARKVNKVITLGGANKLVTSNAPEGVDVTTISSSADLIVNPLLSKLNGANNIIISGVSHIGLLNSPEVQRLLLQILQ